jgi:hypothetical protein
MGKQEQFNPFPSLSYILSFFKPRSVETRNKCFSSTHLMK